MQTFCSHYQGQLLEGVECHIYLYCFTFDDINLNRALVIIVLFPTKYSNKKVCANDIRKWKALWFYWYIFLGLLWLFPRPFFRLNILHWGIWDKIERLKCFAENGFKNWLKNPCANDWVTMETEVSCDLRFIFLTLRLPRPFCWFKSLS